MFICEWLRTGAAVVTFVRTYYVEDSRSRTHDSVGFKVSSFVKISYIQQPRLPHEVSLSLLVPW